VIAIIPARGGSKRIPRKNIKPFLGVPLIARTVSTLRESGVFDRIIVSTEDEEIAAVAVGAGAEAPFRRPSELADDFTPTIPVIAHAIEELQRQGWAAEVVCCVYPAAVLCVADDFRQALKILQTTDCDYVFSAAAYPYPIQRALRVAGDGGCEMFWPEHRQTRTQDLVPAFHDAGQFYFGRGAAWLEHRAIFSPASRMHLLPKHRVEDIDTDEDWHRAELLYRMAIEG